MRRQSKNIINAPLEAQEHESRYTEEKEEASCPALSKDQKVCKVTKSKGLRAVQKENLSTGNEVPMQKCTKNLEKESCCPREDVDSCQFPEFFFETLKGDVAGEHTLPLNGKENVPRSRPVSLGGECYLTPKRDKAEERTDCGISEKWQKTPIDFATVTTAEFGITQESFTKGSLGKSPMSLKYRRRSAIGVRGSPENNTLIQFLAQQRSIRQKEPFTEISPFKYERVRSLKDKIEAFETSFKSVQESEGETGHPGLSQVDDTSQEAGSSQNTVPFIKEQNTHQWSEKFRSDNSRAGLEENSRQNLTDSSKSDTKICTILSSYQDVSVTEPAAALSEEHVNEGHNPTASLEAVLIGEILETDHDFTSDHITKDLRSDVLSDLSRKKVSFVEELSLEIFDERKPPITPVQMGNTPLNEHGQSGSRLRSVLKKTPVKPLLDNTKKYWNNAIDRGGDESLTVSSCADISEALQTEKPGSHSSEKAKKKRVTFGEVLSPEIFDEALPANTPLRKGATPVRHPGVQGHSPLAGAQLSEDPLPQPNFDGDDEEVTEPLQELVEDPVAAEALLPVGSTEATTDKSDTVRTCSTKSKQCSTVSEGTDFSISRDTNTQSDEDVENPRKNKSQRPKNITSSAKKTQKKKHTSYGKRRKKKVKKSLYGKREMASKKPLLSPIPEIPEVFSFLSSPDSPKANAHLSGNTKSGNSQKDVQQDPVVEKRRKNTSAVYMDGRCKDLVEASSSHVTVLHASDGDVESVSGIDYKCSTIVSDAKCGSDPPDSFQQGEKTACVKEAEEPGSLIENKKLQENLLNKAEQLTRIRFLEQEDIHVREGAQRTWCPQEDSVRGSPSRRRGGSGAIYIPPVEKLKITGNNLPVFSFNIEEVLSVPQLKNDSFEPFRRKNDNSGEKRVRRSMRLHKDAENAGLAWVQVPNEIQERPPLLGSSRRARRTISTSILTASENIHPSEQNLTQFSAPGKENNDSVRVGDGPCKRWRRRSVGVSTPQETRTSSQTQKRSITKSVYRKDRSKQHYEDVEIPLENNI